LPAAQGRSGSSIKPRRAVEVAVGTSTPATICRNSLSTNIDRAVGVSGTATETTKGTPASDNSAAVFVDRSGDAAPPPLIRTIGTPAFTSNSAT